MTSSFKPNFFPSGLSEPISTFSIHFLSPPEMQSRIAERAAPGWHGAPVIGPSSSVGRSRSHTIPDLESFHVGGPFVDQYSRGQQIDSEMVDKKLLKEILELESMVKELWEERHPGVALDEAQLLKEFKHDAKNAGTVASRIFLKVIRDLNRHRKVLVEQLARYHERFEIESLVKQGSAKISCDGLRSWAIIIGINSYDPKCSPGPLQGPVHDASLVHQFFTDDLKIPYSHITLLTTDQDCPPHRQPTRHNIISALYDLRDNPSIKPNDDIIIYFSGHGTRYGTTRNLRPAGEKGGYIEVLCPVDRGGNVPDISDRELNVILQEIKEAKGPNIVLILDACYSGGMARGDATLETYRAVRSASPLQMPEPQIQLERMLRAADVHPRKRSTKAVFSSSYQLDPSACIVMAAYRGDEQACEQVMGPADKVYGVFTYLLVGSLKSCSKGSRTTYADIEEQVAALLRYPLEPGSRQHPHFLGERKGLRLWYLVDKWSPEQHSMASVWALVVDLRRSLCRVHQPQSRPHPLPHVEPHVCSYCHTARKAFDALEAAVEFSVALHPELRAVQAELRCVRVLSASTRAVQMNSHPVSRQPDDKIVHKQASLRSLKADASGWVLVESDLCRLERAFQPVHTKHLHAQVQHLVHAAPRRVHESRSGKTPDMA